MTFDEMSPEEQEAEVRARIVAHLVKMGADLEHSKTAVAELVSFRRTNNNALVVKAGQWEGGAVVYDREAAIRILPMIPKEFRSEQARQTAAFLSSRERDDSTDATIEMRRSIRSAF